MKNICLSAAVLLLVPAVCLAHSGGLNSEGCHNNRKTGDYHCHRAQPTQSRQTSNSYSAASESSSAAYFKNCKEARAAGAAPLRIGEPGYRPALDRDGDGVACE